MLINISNAINLSSIAGYPFFSLLLSLERNPKLFNFRIISFHFEYSGMFSLVSSGTYPMFLYILIKKKLWNSESIHSNSTQAYFIAFEFNILEGAYMFTY